MDTTKWISEPRQVGLALLVIRIAGAMAFLYHGAGILFGLFGGPGISAFAQFTHLPTPVAALVGLAEFCGGIALLTGVLARLGAACIIIVMLGAIFMVHLPHGFDVTKQGIEYPLTQLLIALAVLIAGAGPYSLAYLARHPANREQFHSAPPPIVQS